MDFIKFSISRLLLQRSFQKTTRHLFPYHQKFKEQDLNTTQFNGERPPEELDLPGSSTMDSAGVHS